MFRPLAFPAILLSMVFMTACTTSSKTDPVPLAIGAIADCQYADKDSQGARLYRSCPAKLESAVETLNDQNLAFTVHLGDLIDEGWENFASPLAILEKSRHPVKFILGNHDFAVEEPFKQKVPHRLAMPARYYSLGQGGWTFLFLDGNDLSTYTWPEGSAKDAESRQALRERFPGAETWNGGIGAEQLQWMDRVLADADRAGRRAILFSHFPVYPENPHNLWNANEILALLDRHPSVTAWFNGHNHDGNYGERNGVHYVNLKGMLDTAETAFAVISFQEDRIEITGHGREPDRILPIPSASTPR